MSQGLPPDADKLAYSLLEAAQATGLPVSTVEALITSGQLPARPVPGGEGHYRYVLLRPDLERWLVAESTSPRMSRSVKSQRLIMPWRPEWSMPKPLEHWATIFDVDRKTLAAWLRSGDVLARRRGRLWSIDIHELPAAER